MTLAFESRFLLLEIFKVEVLEILRQLALYVTIGKPETNNTTRINQTEQQIDDYQQYDAIAR
jgi:hypothetical protein